MIEFSENDRILVTGASSGIGKEIAVKLVENGASVIACGRNESKLMDIKEKLGKSDRFNYEIKELTEDMDSLDKWIGGIAEKYGNVSGLVLSAGVQETMPVQAVRVAKAQKIFDVNFFSNIALIKGYLKQSDINMNNSIVFISSFTSELGLPGILSYSASKGAVNSAVKTLAVELSKKKIRVNAILAGHVRSELFEKDSKISVKSFLDKLEPRYPLGIGTAEDIANATCFLLSGLSKWITGTNIHVDGGASINFL